MNWQEELINKANELKIEGGELYDSISSRSSSGNNTRSSRDTRSSIPTKNRENIINDTRKEEEIMITREAALDDLQKLEKEATDASSKVIVKVAMIVIKMLATIRSNQLLTDADKIAIQKAREARKSKEQK